MQLQETVGVSPAQPKQTIGEYRVGITFNPSNNEKVDIIKMMSADIINYLESFKPGADGEKIRLIDHAQTLIEDAAMNGVKAATKNPR